MKDFIKLVVALVVLIAIIATSLWVQSISYKDTTHELCEPYKKVPESQLSRVPDGCITQYYEGRL